MEEKVQSGNLGTKTGNGLFTYSDNDEVQKRITERDENFIRLVNIKNKNTR